MDRSKIILSSIAGVTIVVCLVFSILGIQTSGEAGAAIEARDQAVRSIEKVYRQDNPFPSRENVAAIRSDADRMEAIRSALTNTLAARNVPVVKLTPSVFVQLLRKIATTKVASAPVVDGRKVIEPSFNFGFDRYIGQNPIMPKEDDIPRLLQQLYVVDEIVDILYDAHVSRLQSIDRELFETVDGSVEEAQSSRHAVRKKTRGARNAGQPGGHRMHEHFSVKFQARQEAAIAFVNGLSKMKYFVLITDISFQKTGADIRFPGAMGEASPDGLFGDSGQESRRSRSSRRRRSVHEEKVEVAADPVVPTISKLPPGQRLMAGAEIDPQIVVTIEFDIYSFAMGGK